MSRAAVCILILAAGGRAAPAGELDRESSTRLVPAAAASAAPAATAHRGSEMDRESPRPAHGWRWGARVYGWGWGGVAPYPLGFGYPAYIAYRPVGFFPAFSSGFYPAFGWPYFPAYYAPFGWGWW